MTDREVFQKNIQKFLDDSGTMQKDLASAVGVSNKTVSAWIRGRGYPRADVMEKIARFFDVRLSDLVDQEPTEDEEETMLVNMFRSLSTAGKIKLLERAEELVVLYGKKSNAVSSGEVAG